MFRFCILIPVVLMIGCASPHRVPDVAMLYNRSAQYHGIERNPVIVIPGVMGSRLEEMATGTPVWGAFTGDYMSPDRPDGARLAALPMVEGKTLSELTDTVESVAALDRIRINLLGLPIQLSAYVQILQTLGVGGYRDQALAESYAVDYGDTHFTCFQFHYDWRRSNVENARALGTFIEEKAAYVREETQRRFGRDIDVKFDIVAHSMGGLLTRYYLRYGGQPLPADGSMPELTWAGAEQVDRVILVGTPSAGSANVIQVLKEGLKLGPVAYYPPALVGTYPSLYELMPRARHEVLVDADDPSRILNPFPPALWEELGWGLVAPDQDRVLRVLLPDVDDAGMRQAIARDHLAKCLRNAAQFHQALDRPAESPDSLTLELVAGDAEQTAAVLAAQRDGGKLTVHKTAPGDGTVARYSALMDERTGGDWAPLLVSPIEWDQVMFLFRDHLGMTQDPMFADNILYRLLQEPRKNRKNGE